MKAIVRLCAIVCEIAIPVILGARYGVEAGAAAIFLMIAYATDMALKELIDTEEQEEHHEA